MLDFLPQNIKEGLSNLNLRLVYELRLRANQPVTVNFNGAYRYLGARGLTERGENALVCSVTDIADCVYRAGKYSVYSVEEQIKKGFITAENGVRIGLAGEFVFERDKPLALRNFYSLCIRIPHEIVGCGEEIYKRCMSDRVRNVLIMSPPGLGKTTILRDISRIISQKTKKNLLICDERGELSIGNVGESCDIVSFSDKATAFEVGIRVLRPDVIVTDELSEIECKILEKAVNAGISVIATAHFSSVERVKGAYLGVFERFVLLDNLQLGKIDGIYDNEGKLC